MFCRLLITLLFTVSCVAGQQPVVTSEAGAQAPAKSTYEALLERLKQRDQTVDFKELRLAYTETKSYGPYGGDVELRRNMFAALRTDEYDKALGLAGKLLESNYLDIMGHFASFIAQRELGQADQATYHRFVFDGLLNSIRNSGDGKTLDTAFIVISTEEEYALFNYLGLRPTAQALLKQNGHSYDKLSAQDLKTNQPIVYYFNIDKPVNWLARRVKK